MSTQVPFTTRGNTYQPTPETALLLKDIGGVEALTRMTTLFYEEAFRNPHIRVFFHHTEDPHAERLANWVSEKMGSYESLKEPTLPLPSPRTKQVDDVERLAMESEDAIAYERNCPLVQVRGVTNGIKQCPHWIARHPWTYEREMTRDLTPSLIDIQTPYGIRDITVTDRSSAHAAAWHSPKRPAEDLGNHFQLDDCRVWLRLHFWGCRKAGVFPPTNSRANTTTKTEAPPLALATQQRFQDWYMKFLSHFIRIYERTAQEFVPLEAAWSLSSENITRYEKALETGSAGMEEVIDILNPREAMSKVKSL